MDYTYKKGQKMNWSKYCGNNKKNVTNSLNNFLLKKNQCQSKQCPTCFKKFLCSFFYFICGFKKKLYSSQLQCHQWHVVRMRQSVYKELQQSLQFNQESIPKTNSYVWSFDEIAICYSFLLNFVSALEEQSQKGFKNRKDSKKVSGEGKVKEKRNRVKWLKNKSTEKKKKKKINRIKEE